MAKRVFGGRKSRAPNERLLAEKLADRHSSSRHKRRAEEAEKAQLKKKYMKLAKRHPGEFRKAAKQILGDEL